MVAQNDIIQTSVSINTSLWAPSHPCSFTYYTQLLLLYNGRVKQLVIWLQKSEIFIFWSFPKGLPTFLLGSSHKQTAAPHNTRPPILGNPLLEDTVGEMVSLAELGWLHRLRPTSPREQPMMAQGRKALQVLYGRAVCNL